MLISPRVLGQIRSSILPSIHTNSLSAATLETELLAVTLEEKHRWLEGAKETSLVRTEHKNLEYLCSAKRLNESVFLPVL